MSFQIKKLIEIARETQLSIFTFAIQPFLAFRLPNICHDKLITKTSSNERNFHSKYLNFPNKIFTNDFQLFLRISQWVSQDRYAAKHDVSHLKMVNRMHAAYVCWFVEKSNVNVLDNGILNARLIFRREWCKIMPHKIHSKGSTKYNVDAPLLQRAFTFGLNEVLPLFWVTMI